MMLYDWPGNVRELENAVERSIVVGKERQIMAADLPIFYSELSCVDKDRSIKDMEKTHISHILEDTRWNISKTAKILGINRSTLYTKIKTYQIQKIS